MKDVKTMTNKAYIVANEQQEREVLEKLEEKGALWGNGKNATNFIPFRKFPYVIYCNGDKHISWDNLCDLDVDKIIVFDGRKEEQMSDKYVVSQEFMNKLDGWKIDYVTNSDFLDIDNIGNLPPVVSRWWIYADITDKERNNRLIAIIRWVNGEDVFEVEKPKKWVVRSKEIDSTYCYAQLLSENNNTLFMGYSFANATRFDTKEEAEGWANSHQEVIEVEE